MNKSIDASIARGMALSLSGSTPVTEMSKYVLENALGRKVTMDGYATPAQVLRHLEEVKDEAAAKAAAAKADHQQHHYEFSQALDSVGLSTVFHPEELRFDSPEVSLHRGPNDDTLTHRYYEGAHQVALARRTGAGTRVGYGSHQNPRDALMMAIKDFNGKRAKGVNEDYEFDKSGKYITEASKSPNAVRMTSSVRQHLGGGMIAQTRNGKYYLLDPHATNGKLPRPGEEIDPSKHHYIGDGEWTPKHAETVEKINAAAGKVPAIKAVDEADHSDFVKALKDSGMDSHFRDSNSQSLTNPGTHDFYGKSGEVLSHERNPLTGNHLVMLRKETPAGTKRAFGSGVDATSALRDVMRKYGDSMTEAESLDELSKDTLASYIRKASIDARHREFRAGRNAVLGIAHNNDYRESDKDLVKSLGRQRGITKAADKLAHESVNEAAPPDMEDWVKSNKARFVKRYGDKKGHEVLYATAWKLHDKKANEDTLAESGTIEVIPHQVGITKDGKIVSPFSAGIDHIEKTGKWTWGVTDHNGNYTTGMSRTPVDSRAEAEKIAHDVSAKTGYKVKVNESALDELHPETAKRYMHKAIRSMIRANDDSKFERRSKGISRASKILRGGKPVKTDESIAESEQDNIDHVKHMKAYHAAVKATDDASMAKVHFRMRHDISQPDHREAYNQLKRKHREARKAEAAAAEHVKGVLFAKHALGESELNELSRQTLRNYVRKAVPGLSFDSAYAGFLSGLPDSERSSENERRKAYIDKSVKKRDKRLDGVALATDKLAEDQLDELSPATIRGYLTKAIADHSNMKADRGFLSGRSYADHEAGKPTDYDREKAKTMLNKRADKRMKSIQRAIDNLGDDTQRPVKLPAQFGENADVSPLFSNK